MIRSQSGRILQNTLTDGATVETSKYTHDAAGRLVQAVIPRHTLSHAFAYLEPDVQARFALPPRRQPQPAQGRQGQLHRRGATLERLIRR